MAKKRQSLLNESVGGKPLTVSTSDPNSPLVIHEIFKSQEDYDEIFIYAVNKGAQDATLSILHQVYDEDDILVSSTEVTKITMSPDKGLNLVVPGLIFNCQNDTEKSYISAISSEVGAFNIVGWYNIMDFGKQNRIPNV